MFPKRKQTGAAKEIQRRFAKPFLEKKQELNYREAENPGWCKPCCDHCENVIKLSPYSQRCLLIGTGIPGFDKGASVGLNNVCDKFSPLYRE